MDTQQVVMAQYCLPNIEQLTWSPGWWISSHLEGGTFIFLKEIFCYIIKINAPLPPPKERRVAKEQRKDMIHVLKLFSKKQEIHLTAWERNASNKILPFKVLNLQIYEI